MIKTWTSFFQNKNTYQIRGIILMHLTECGELQTCMQNTMQGQEQCRVSAHCPHLSLPLSHKRWWWISGLQWQEEGVRKRLQSSKWFAHKRFPERYQEWQIPAAPSTVSASKRNSRSPGAWEQWGNFSFGPLASAKATEPCPQNWGCFHTGLAWKLVSHKSRRFKRQWILETLRVGSESQIYDCPAK